MFDLWREELTEEETESLLDKAVAEIKKRKMEMPVILALEMHKPLSYVSSQMFIALSPLIVPFVGFEFMNDYSRLASKPENVEKLLVRLEQAKNTPPSGDSEESCSTTTLDG